MRESAPTLRPARSGDSDLLFAWVNAPDARAAALSDSGPVARETHDAWVATRLQDPHCRLWIIERAGDLVGVVRLEGPANAVEVSIFVTRDTRRGGIARGAITQALDKRALEGGAFEAVARVRLENHASRRLFEALGFTVAATRGDGVGADGVGGDHVVLRRAVAAPVSS